MPEQADRPGDEGHVVGHGGAAVQRLGHPGTEELGDLQDLLLGADGALADQHRHALSGVEEVGGALQVGVARADHRLEEPDRRRDRSVGAGRLGVLGLLDVVGHDHAGDRARRLGDAHGAVDQVRGLLGGDAHLHELAGHVLEQAGEVDLLLEVGSQRHAGLLADDRHHGAWSSLAS